MENLMIMLNKIPQRKLNMNFQINCIRPKKNLKKMIEKPTTGLFILMIFKQIQIINYLMEMIYLKRYFYKGGIYLFL